ncbi:phosphomannomutase/phosphoglucomutase [Caulobacter sp. RHG1]|uniref:phosphomannomutase/phosphoglucomutase n=1 Tax=Caulobacter sp. (strain RHG1) TaxID=2545762 RepID=UPI001552300A|nr:phosphomannomutase/phosphoglucomutase [Caulobacter sp. RHG1]NQE63145.1 Phosphoglucosamine mutase / Phosphomannomutase [Caulobacter sp. RHG1]
MFSAPRADLVPNTAAYENESLVKATGFREYDARWLFGPEINLLGIQALGLGLGTYIHELGQSKIVVGHDFRSYSSSIKNALILGLISAGCEVHDIGLALSPTAYFAQFDLDIPCVAMVTASHNENGWTGVKMGAQKPLTFGPDEMGRLKDIVLNAKFVERDGGKLVRVQGEAQRYIDDVAKRASLKRPLKVIAACGNGTAGAFVVEALKKMGVAEVIPMDTDLDYTFPKYNPNPEDHEMLHEMAKAVREHGADIALGFDGDGDRCGVVDDEGEEIFADKIGLMLARDLAPLHPGATFVVDVKSTGLYATDEILAKHGCTTLYWKTGHSYIKRKSAELGALAGFEKSGHFFMNGELGRGYDDGLVAAAAILSMLDRNPGKKLSELKKALPVAFTSLTMSPHCDDEKKYGVVADVVKEYEDLFAAGGSILGRKITEVITVNGVRVHLEDGSWVLVRASSNKPEIVVVVESTQSEDDMRALFRQEVKPRLGDRVGKYNQEI